MTLFCPLKILIDSFYTVKTQKLEESERIFKGPKSVFQGF